MNENALNHVSWTIIEQYFKENEQCLVSHHINSYNYFISNGIPLIFKENNPCRFLENVESNQTECLIYLGGKTGDAIYFGKPVIYDETTNYKHYMYPNDARLRNMTYGITIHYDVDIDFIYYNEMGEKIIETSQIEKVFLGKFPIMVQSKLCILNGLSTNVRFNLGECRNDYGGYFIIDGKEKVIISQEKFADNMLYIKENEEGHEYTHSAEIRSVSEDTSKPIRVNSVAIVAPTANYSNKQIVVNIPNVRKPIPLFILMRAFGIESDKQIIEYCLLDLEKNQKYIDLFIPSVHHASVVFNQQSALEFIGLLTKHQSVYSAHDVLMNYFLAHVGTDNYIEKAYFVGYMVRKLLRVYLKDDHPTDRDNFKCKRIELSGSLMYDLFREYYLKQKQKIKIEVERLHYNNTQYSGSMVVNSYSNIVDIFKKHGLMVEDGVRKGFKGKWGSMQYTQRIGLVQDLSRLSWNSCISHLRKINLSMDPTAKVVKPHLLNNSQFGYIDPVDTPDGGNVGLHKHLAISTIITTEYSGNRFTEWLFERFSEHIVKLKLCLPSYANVNTKLFVNGRWVGLIAEDPLKMAYILKLYKRNGVIPFHTCIYFNYKENELCIYTDGGRMTRPLYYIDHNGKDDRSYVRAIPDRVSSRKHKPSDLQELSSELSWTKIVSGFARKKAPTFHPFHNTLYTNDLIEIKHDDPTLIKELSESASIIEYIDGLEEESALIAFKMADIGKFHTHLEIDPSLMLGVLGNSIIYPEHNPLPRNAFSCGQSKQAVSMYHTNYQMRLDKMSVILQYGQVPLIKSRYLELVNKEENPYGINTIVAIMCYTGYNVEDAILINQGAVDRGLFRTTYHTLYESSEDMETSSEETTKTTFFNFKTGAVKTSPGYDYSFLDENGVVIENTPIHDKIVMIGAITTTTDSEEISNASVFTKKGQLGYVDKTFITENEKGLRLAKIRVREERIPAIGDKMASRAGQKGTIGLIIPEKDMPFTDDGIKPDIIINPHAIPSRMTIGQLVECVFGKACLANGAYGNCTAFETNGPNHELYGKLLNDAGFHSSGTQVLYNGMTGEQIESNIFIGPTYYMRLKHMVKDKINYRSNDGPNTMLTRQPVQGRANDGGLRIGEMERDAIMSHGMTSFLSDSFLKRADEYYMAVCNKTGMIAVYNPEEDIFFSPSIDGPGQFGEIEGKPIKQISRFGRSFSMVRVPYSFKQLIQELQVINVQMRLITDDNVDNLLNMTESNNINKLLKIKTDSTDLSYLLAAHLENQTKRANGEIEMKPILDKMEELKKEAPIVQVREPPKVNAPVETNPVIGVDWNNMEEKNDDWNNRGLDKGDWNKDDWNKGDWNKGEQSNQTDLYVPSVLTVKPAIDVWSKMNKEKEEEVKEDVKEVDFSVPQIMNPSVEPKPEEEELPEGWVKHTSKKYNKPYYYNEVTKKSVWKIEDIPVPKQNILTTIEEKDDNEMESKVEENNQTRTIQGTSNI